MGEGEGAVGIDFKGGWGVVFGGGGVEEGGVGVEA